jgi:hypothetical protein
VLPAVAASPANEQISRLFQTIHNRSAELAVAKSELELVHERCVHPHARFFNLYLSLSFAPYKCLPSVPRRLFLFSFVFIRKARARAAGYQMRKNMLKLFFACNFKNDLR